MSSHRNRAPWSIRSQLLLAVNLCLGTMIAILLGLRYEREMRQAVQEKQACLNDEAIAIHAAVSHLSREHAPSLAQQYIDNVCREMCASGLPDHHIVVRLQGRVLEAECQPTRSNDLLKLVELQSTLPSKETLVVGLHSSPDLDVYTSQKLATTRRAVRRDVLLQLGVIAFLGVLAAIIVNVVLFHVFDRPLRTLVQTVDGISAGQLGREAPICGSLEIVKITEAINQMSRSLDRHEQERRRRIQRAREIQRHLLPFERSVPGVVTALLFEPADEVGGDYFDFLELRDGSWLICVADVAGHGVSAAMGVAMLKMLLLVAAEREEADPVSILTFVNLKFCESTLPEHFASMFVGRWRPHSRCLEYASAGHEPPLLLDTRGSIRNLPGTGLVLGVDPDTEWTSEAVTLATGDRLLLFSDGIIETRTDDGELFGRRRLSTWFSQYRDLAPSQIVTELSGELSNHRGEHSAEDDQTLLVLEVAGPAHIGSSGGRQSTSDAA